ncbi:MAG: hypothetical protein AAGJ81_03455 [Verrucomicrobiota bacterium]
MKPKPTFKGGRNIAMKVPPHQYEETVRFYRDLLGLKQLKEHLPAVGFEFGRNHLWIDRVPGMSQAEMWLEIMTDDISASSEFFREENVTRCDEIEDLPDGFEAFWISSPASIIHLVCKEVESR